MYASVLDDQEHLRKRAQELRDLAIQMSSETAREQLLLLAEDYDRLGRTAAQRAAEAARSGGQRRAPDERPSSERAKRKKA